MDTVEVRITYPPGEISRAISFFTLRVSRIRNFLILTYSILFVALALTALYSRYPLLALIFLAAGLVIHYIYYIRPIGRYKSYCRKDKGGVCRFGEENVQIITENMQSTISWAMYKKGYDVPSAFLLADESGILHIFPKSCFANGLEVGRFCALLARKITVFETWR